MIPTRDPLLVKSRVGYLPDDVGFYEDLTAAPEPALHRRPQPPPVGDAASDRIDDAARRRRPGRRRRPQGRRLLAWHAPAARSRRRAGEAAVDPDPRRADRQHRPRGRARAAAARRAAALRPGRHGAAVVAPAAPGRAGVRPDRRSSSTGKLVAVGHRSTSWPADARPTAGCSPSASTASPMPARCSPRVRGVRRGAPAGGSLVAHRRPRRPRPTCSDAVARRAAAA